MAAFIKGMALCEGFFREHAKGILDRRFPGLLYSAGLIGYGSDVLGYDDPVSADHMWGPRFYLFLKKEDMGRREAILRALSEELPCTYRGYSVHFTPPDPRDNGVRRPCPIERGPVDPLVWVQTFDSFLEEQLGTAAPEALSPAQWLALSEHRLLSLVSGRFFADGLGCAKRLEALRYYPRTVRLYLVASCWEAVASEQAFVRRCGDVGDELGARVICARMAERLMRLCFLYRETYAPYPKWLGAAFARLEAPTVLKATLGAALSANDPRTREEALVSAQLGVAELHNASGLTAPVACRAEDYYGRAIRVIFAEKLAEAARAELKGTSLEGVPLLGSFSQLGGLSGVSDDPAQAGRLARLYLQP